MNTEIIDMWVLFMNFQSLNNCHVVFFFLLWFILILKIENLITPTKSLFILRELPIGSNKNDASFLDSKWIKLPYMIQITIFIPYKVFRHLMVC